MPRTLLFLADLALTVYAIADVAQSDEQEPAGLQKIVWILLIVFLPFAGAIAWLVASRNLRARRRARYQPGFPAGEVPPAQYARRRRTWEPDDAAADDDPEMRWLLEQARLKREREQAAASEHATDDETPTA